MKNKLFFVLLWCTGIGLAQTHNNVDNIAGNDNNPGTSEAEAFQSINKINTLTVSPGDAILFKIGGAWTETLKPLGSGSTGSRIVIGSYGDGNLSIIEDEVKVYNTDYMSAAIKF